MFQIAKPVWAKDRQEEINLTLVFSFPLAAGSTRLKLTASTAYQLFINDHFIMMGPARAGHGYFRVDDLDVTPYLERETNQVEIIVAGYNVFSYEYANHPSFLTCEATANGSVVFATGRDVPLCYVRTERIQKASKFSYQRVLCEVYDFDRTAHDPVTLAVQDTPNYLTRNVPYPVDVELTPECISETGILGRKTYKGAPWYFDRMLNAKVEQFDALECNLHAEMHSLDCIPHEKMPAQNQLLTDNTYIQYSFASNSTGLIGLDFTVKDACELYLIFDEILIDGHLSHTRFDPTCCVKLMASPGTYSFLSMEPYTYRYIQICVTKGAVELHRHYLKEIAYPPVASTTFQDPQIQVIFEAAVNTFRQNAPDVYMDCPSRERAGWLCDSFFTGRSEFAITGKSLVEYNFFENYLRSTGYESIPPLPEAMLPMCYPSNHSGGFIPNWAMWFVLELEEYRYARGGDQALVAELKGHIFALLDYFKKFENSDGLLEDLDGWIFLEWSRANDKDVVCGVNYPTNMTYAACLEAAGHLYDEPSLCVKGHTIKEQVRRQSFNGSFFVDNAIRIDGVLTPTETTTEVCQYYAFFFDVATPSLYPELFQTLLTDFGPQRKETKAYPDVPFANAFIGNYLRLDILYRYQCYEQMLQEFKGYFYRMAVKTGTLWENDTERASCNHGFASHVAYWLLQLREHSDLVL
ncbi:hypothetical protein [Bianquea renquensis]|uniref:Alpha-L-rhamnosidase six-hairpin glycosidase domain-containing protein n=1 Tax=Bianquea renquensis TaxID=2763661 RepID=A0A926I1K8_9FIRM|nr:hypothetical protein [Bianquea renquensis]MBC8543111.1 hypothetical protein [Bianquea renquensis]